MKNVFAAAIIMLMVAGYGCSNNSTGNENTGATAGPQPVKGQSGVNDDVSNPNVVQIAAQSPDHTTLVTAVQAAELVDALSNAGPFTVFAPTNAAFDKLPAGTVENLLTPEKKDVLTDILQYHVTVGVYKTEQLQAGENLGQVNGGNISISKQGDKIIINNKATIITSVTASNGIIHIIDGVLLPE